MARRQPWGLRHSGSAHRADQKAFPWLSSRRAHNARSPRPGFPHLEPAPAGRVHGCTVRAGHVPGTSFVWAIPSDERDHARLAGGPDADSRPLARFVAPLSRDPCRSRCGACRRKWHLRNAAAAVERIAASPAHRASTGGQTRGCSRLRVGHTFGPFETQVGRRAFAQVLRAAEQVVVREALSARAARLMSPEAVVVVAPDFAFLLPQSARAVDVPAGRLSGRRACHGHASSTRTTSAASASSASWAPSHGRFSTPARSTTSWLCRRSWDRLRWRTIGSLRPQLVQKIGRLEASVWAGGNDARTVAGIYAASTGVVAVRLHGAVLAMGAGTPSFAISYFTGKTRGIMEGLVLGDSWCEFDDFTQERALAWWSTRCELFPQGPGDPRLVMRLFTNEGVVAGS